MYYIISAIRELDLKLAKFTQQTMTRDFTCSVSEFTRSTGSTHMFLYVNSENKFGVSKHVYKFFT